LVAPASAAVNFTSGKPVTITGDVGVIICCWPDATVFPPAPLSSLVDGLYLPAGTQWQDGTVWWDERPISYRDEFDVWQFLGTAGPFGGAGMQVRSGAATWALHVLVLAGLSMSRRRWVAKRL
jgi:hypothetical protein